MRDHGHYLDRHTTTPAFERVAAGAMARFLKLPLSAMSETNDYERLLAPIYAWMFAISADQRARDRRAPTAAGRRGR